MGDIGDRGGDANGLGANLPVVNLGTSRTAVSLSLSATSTCAVLDNRTLKCWGLNNNGQLGLGDTRNRGYAPAQMGDALPAVALDTVPALVTIADGDSYLVSTDGSMQSWGYGYQCIQLGNGSCGNGTPLDVSLPSNTAVEAASGVWTAMVRLTSGDIVGWGDGWAGQRGAGYALRDSWVNGIVQLGTGRTALSLTSQGYAYCAVLDDHSVKCWGYGAAGGLGLGDTSSRGNNNDMGDGLPAVDLGSGRTARSLSGMAHGVCAILDTGTVKCWGDNSSGALGLGDTQNRGDSAASMGDNLPTVDLGTGRTVRQLAAGQYFVCALLDNNLVKCWGDNSVGSLGLGDLQRRGDRAGTLGDALPYVQLW